MPPPSVLLEMLELPGPCRVQSFPSLFLERSDSDPKPLFQADCSSTLLIAPCVVLLFKISTLLSVCGWTQLRVDLFYHPDLCIKKAGIVSKLSVPQLTTTAQRCIGALCLLINPLLAIACIRLQVWIVQIVTPPFSLGL